MLQRATILALFALLAAPGLGWLFGEDQERSYAEARTLAQAPELHFTGQELEQYPAAFETYLSDQLGLRTSLVASHALLHFLAGVSPNDRVIVGEQGWLFHPDMGPTGGNIEAPLFGPRRLERWIASYTARARWVERQGGHYLLAIPPEKHEVEGEHLPKRVRARVATLGSRMDEVHERLRRDRPFPYTDLREDLRAARASEVVFQHTDTHWTYAGADVAQRQLARAVATFLPDLEPTRRPGAYRDVEGQSGDLARLLGLGGWVGEPTGQELVGAHVFCEQGDTDEETRRTNPNCLVLDPACERIPFEVPWTDGPQAIAGVRAFEVVCPDASVDATVLVFRVSFFSRIQPFFSAYFRRTVYLWSPLVPRRLRWAHDRFQPDVVIEARAGRRAMAMPLGGRF